MYTFTLVCYGAEIGFGEAETFEAARLEAEEEAGDSVWYPRADWGYISTAPNGMTVQYNV